MTKQYAQRDIESLDGYMTHVMAMTAEQLHSKSEIAAELAWRDSQIAALQQKLDDLAAENAALKAAILKAKDELQEHYDTDGVDSQDSEGNFMDACIRMCDAQSTIEKLENIATPDTDAYLNSVRADAVSNFWNKSLRDVAHVLNDIRAFDDSSEAAGIVHSEIKERVDDSVESLRSVTHDTADKAGAK